MNRLTEHNKYEVSSCLYQSYLKLIQSYDKECSPIIPSSPLSWDIEIGRPSFRYSKALPYVFKKFPLFDGHSGIKVSNIGTENPI